MNTLVASINSFNTSTHLTSMCVEIKQDMFYLLLAELPQEPIGTEVTLAFKETEVILMTSHGNSTANLHHAKITNIECGNVLTHVTLSYHTTSIRALVPTLTFDPLELREGDSVRWMVQPSEISLLRGPRE